MTTFCPPGAQAWNPGPGQNRSTPNSVQVEPEIPGDLRKINGQKDARKMKTIVYAMIIALVFSPPASAGMFDFLGNIFTPAQAEPQTISSWDQLTQDLVRLNTQSNIRTMDEYLDRYGIQTLRIDVMEPSFSYVGSFYVTRGMGVNLKPQRIDGSLTLTERQVRDIMNMARGGNLDIFEKIRIWAMLQ